MERQVPIESVREGDYVEDKEVVEVSHRFKGYVSLVLRGGEVLDGFRHKDFVYVDVPPERGK